MTYGNTIQFGYFLTPDATDTTEVLRRAQVCDRAGYDLIGIQDHPYQSRYLDTWTPVSYTHLDVYKRQFYVRGRAALSDDPDLRRQATAAASYEPAERYILFVLSVEFAFMNRYEAEGAVAERWKAN